MAERVPEPLTYSTTATYHGGWRDIAGTAKIVALSVAAAAVSVLVPVIAFWIGAGIVILGGLVLQPLLVGGITGFLLKQRAVKSLPVMLLIAALTLLSMLLVTHVTLYLNDVYQTASVMLPDSRLSAIRAMLNGSIFRLREMLNGTPGILADFVLNTKFRAESNRIFVPVVLAHAALGVFGMYIAIKIAKDRDWCDRCGGPLNEPRNLAVLPVTESDRLAAAVVDENVQAAGAVVVATHDAPLGTACVVARLFQCPTCDTRTIDVVEKTNGVQIPRTKRVAADEAMLTALAATPVSVIPLSDRTEKSA